VVRACDEGRYLRLDCAALPPGFREQDVAVELLVQWKQRDVRNVGDFRRRLQQYFDGLSITVPDVLRHILALAAPGDSDDGEPAVLVAVDGALRVEGHSFHAVLHYLAWALVIHRLRVFVVVSGEDACALARHAQLDRANFGLCALPM
jgi:hypothetical protein